MRIICRVIIIRNIYNINNILNIYIIYLYNTYIYIYYNKLRINKILIKDLEKIILKIKINIKIHNHKNIS